MGARVSYGRSTNCNLPSLQRRLSARVTSQEDYRLWIILAARSLRTASREN